VEEIEQKVKTILMKAFLEEEIRFDHEPGERVAGIIVSRKFEGKDHLSRQNMIWDLLYDHLALEDRHQVLGFMAFTPEEEELYSEPDILD
jgi:acid stress-induced BolA-like protein IbaG/YrbA